MPDYKTLPLPQNGTSRPDLSRRGSLRKRLRRGFTYAEVQMSGVINHHEKSPDFSGLPISPEEVKRLPRKLRKYYQHLALLRDHYVEVDTLLSGELPSVIANSFQQTPVRSDTRLDLAEEIGPHVNKMPGWSRRESAWRASKRRARDPFPDPESGETTGLLSAEEKEERRDRIARLALNVNTAVNVVLVVAKGFAVLNSSSISLTASLVDSALDLLSTFIILGTTWASGLTSDQNMYPAGKRRFEPLGVLVFSVAMIASFIQVFIESFQRATHSQEDAVVELSKVGIGTMVATIAVKLFLWIWCARIPSSGVQALAQDAENDVFFNIMSLAFPFVGTRVHWRLLDPIGGMVLSLYIIVEWIKTLAENFAKLSGKSASRDQITRVLYLVMRFNPVIEIGDVECYHMGDDLIVEIDVILPQSSTLHFAHDVGETIQCVLESLDGVLRAYVHCDYSSSNP
ncbi:MAG: hypothetical protein TREMPRED_002417 [Tremellales sp. Tagirdzhanova-0007]|nr:MAG: hypothetical protein TREMPRED_002417 [Tremellales sp. Tagirdzhanova-0007]